mgnify:CR=1 FL=1
MAENKSNEERIQAIENRVENARQKIVADRAEMRKKAVAVSLELLNGIEYKEDFPVKFINGTIGLLVIRPLAEGEIIEIFSKMGMDRINRMGKSGTIEDYEFFWHLCSASTGFPIELIKKTFAMGESAVVGERILEMSGFSEKSEENMESFPEK